MKTRSYTTIAAIMALGVLAACGSSATSSSAATSSTAATCGTSDTYSKAVLADQPVAYYKLSDSSGPKMCDQSTAHHDGTYASSGITYSQTGPLTDSNVSAITADGTVNPATSDNPIPGPTAFSLEGWFKTTMRHDQVIVDVGQAGKGGIAGIGPSSSTSPLCGSYTDGVGFDTYDGYISGNAQSAGINWHYIAGTYSSAGGGTATIYLDGKLLTSQTIQIQPAASKVRVGYWIDNVCNLPSTGSLAQIAIYKTVLTADQIQAHFKAASSSS